MNIVYITNTFTPHVGGVARSLEAFSESLRSRGHRVLIVAPEFPDMSPASPELIRIPAIQNFNASDFSVALPVPTGLRDALVKFEPDIIHSHHPFLLGMTAMRLSRTLDIPLLFTHHTLYEQYVHYVATESKLLEKFIIELATNYANLVDHVIAPSASLRHIIQERGVTTPISVVPTGVKTSAFSGADGAAFRLQYGIRKDSFVVGHMGRLAPEKNIDFLSRAVSEFLIENADGVFLVVGEGPCAQEIAQYFSEQNLSDRVLCTGILEGAKLAAALSAMDVFAFTSKSETQGMVLTEAMAAGVPVIALDAPGARDVVIDGTNGRLLAHESVDEFQSAITSYHALTDEIRQRFIAAARATAREFSLDHSVDTLCEIYRGLLRESKPKHNIEAPLGLEGLMARLKAEWDIFTSLSRAGDEALSGESSTRAPQDGSNEAREQ